MCLLTMWVEGAAEQMFELLLYIVRLIAVYICVSPLIAIFGSQRHFLSILVYRCEPSSRSIGSSIPCARATVGSAHAVPLTKSLKLERVGNVLVAKSQCEGGKGRREKGSLGSYYRTYRSLTEPWTLSSISYSSFHGTN